jgi:HSP20 family molecular chaperone IbpA
MPKVPNYSTGYNMDNRDNYISKVLKDDVMKMVRNNSEFMTPRQVGKSLHAGMEEEWLPGRGVGEYIPKNPCAEISLKDFVKYEATYKDPKMTDNTPHSQRVDADSRNAFQETNVQGQNLSGKLKVTDEELIFTVSIPGVEPDRVEVTRIDNRLRVRVQPEKGDEVSVYTMDSNVKQVSLILAEHEDVEDVTLRLGILTVTVDRGRTVEKLTVHADD